MPRKDGKIWMAGFVGVEVRTTATTGTGALKQVMKDHFNSDAYDLCGMQCGKDRKGQSEIQAMVRHGDGQGRQWPVRAVLVELL